MSNAVPRYYIAIVGCGSTGLAAASFLKRDGHRVTLFEQFDTPRPLGAGLLLQPTGLAILACLGLDKAIIGYGAPIHHLYGKSANGKVIFDISYQQLSPYCFGLGIHRASLFDVLYNHAVALGVPIQTSCTVTEVSEDTKPVLIDDKQKRHGPFDLIIDASGRRSRLCQKHAKLKLNRPYPYAAVWGVCHDPGRAFGGNRLQQRYDAAKVMIGILSIGRKPGDGTDCVAFFWSLPAAAYPQWRADGMDEWKKRVLGYWAEVEPFLNQFTSPDDLTFAEY